MTDTTYMGYTLFNDILNKKIQAWNRLNVLNTIKEDLGRNAAINYVAFFNKADNLRVAIMSAAVKKDGWDTVRKSITV